MIEVAEGGRGGRSKQGLWGGGGRVLLTVYIVVLRSEPKTPCIPERGVCRGWEGGIEGPNFHFLHPSIPVPVPFLLARTSLPFV